MNLNIPFTNENLMKKPINFFVYGNPIPKARARTCVQFGKVHSYTPYSTENWENTIRMTASQYARIPLLDSAIKLFCQFVFQKPKSAKKRMFHSVRPDIDNLVKSVTDAIQGVIISDDSRIVSIEASKIYGDSPGVHVILEEI